jgi:hypothetical protein
MFKAFSYTKRAAWIVVAVSALPWRWRVAGLASERVQEQRCVSMKTLQIVGDPNWVGLL